MKTTCALALSIGMATAASAAVIIPVTSIISTGTQNPNGAPLVLGAETTITDGSGLSAPLTVANISTVTHAAFTAGTNSWATDDPAPAGGDFFVDTTNTVVFDIVFDDTYTVDSISSWGYGWNADLGNTISQLDIDYGVGNFTGGTVSGVAMGVTTESGSQYSSTTTALSGFTADRVRITITDNHFGTPGAAGGGDRIGISELAFVGDVVPEPSSAALLGLGGLALILRRRK